MEKNFELLLTAGPANVAESVREALMHPDICHREKEFAQLLSGVRRKFISASGGNQEDYTSVVFVNSGTGAIESVLGSVVHDKKLLVVENGDYGERMRKIAEVLNIPHKSVEFPVNKVADPEVIEALLKFDEEIGYLAMVHMETTLGKINPMKEVGLLAKKYGITYIVDAMASFATEPLNVEADNIDFCIANSNKGIQGIPGLSLVIAKKAELDRIKDKKARSLYLDLYAQYKMEEEKGQTPYTPAIASLFALNQALDDLFEEGIENRIDRFECSSKTLIGGLEKLGITPLLPSELRARTLTTFNRPENISYRKLYEGLKKEGYIIYPGKGPDADLTFRIGNLGIVNQERIKEFLTVFKEVYDREVLS